MSCFMHDRAHVEFLVRAAETVAPLSWIWNVDRKAGTFDRATLPIGDFERAAAIGQMLMETNAQSVRARYGSNADDMIGDVQYGEHRLGLLRPKPADVFQAIASYEYQACEHDEWPGSEARAFCEALRLAYCHRISEAEESDAWAIVKGHRLAKTSNAVRLF